MYYLKDRIQGFHFMLSEASLTKGMKIYQSVIEFILADGNQSTKSLHAKYEDFEVKLSTSNV